MGVGKSKITVIQKEGWTRKEVQTKVSKYSGSTDLIRWISHHIMLSCRLPANHRRAGHMCVAST